MNKKEKCDNKLSIACNHLNNGEDKQVIYLISKGKPLDETDSGCVYGCHGCYMHQDTMKEQDFLDNFSLICDDCLFKNHMLGN